MRWARGRSSILCEKIKSKVDAHPSGRYSAYSTATWVGDGKERRCALRQGEAHF